MARYTGPRLKKVRSLGSDLPGLTRKSAERRPYPPGQHGQGKKQMSDYKIRLMEKQKIRYNYGISEKALRKYFYEAKRRRKVTGNELLSILESRMDSVLFRSGFAATISAGRQLISHGHILVNGKKMDIPSYLVREGDKISFRERSKKLKCVDVCLENPLPYEAASFLDIDQEKREFVVSRAPEREDVILTINEQLVVEYYAAR